MIPICVVTGFLGCGKTTFLKKIVEREQNRRIVYLVNEFASVDIDGELVAKDGETVVTVPGGSIFCKCLVSEFIKQMRMIAVQFHTTSDPLDGVVIEASGMANPMVILDMLRETGLDKEYRLSRVVSVVDPRSLLILIHTLPNIKSQIQASDIVLLNKTDMYPEEQIQKTEETILQINKTTTVIRTNFCSAVVELFPQTSPGQMHGEYAKCKDPHFDSYTRYITRLLDPVKLEAQLTEFKDEIYRVKGFILTESGTFYVDFSQAGFSLMKVDDRRDTQAVLAFIVKGNASEKLILFINEVGEANITKSL
jgi:G3E family GTPase